MCVYVCVSVCVFVLCVRAPVACGAGAKPVLTAALPKHTAALPSLLMIHKLYITSLRADSKPVLNIIEVLPNHTAAL